LHGSNFNVYAQPEKHSPSKDTVGISVSLLKWNMSCNKMNQKTIHMIEYLTVCHLSLMLSWPFEIKEIEVEY